MEHVPIPSKWKIYKIESYLCKPIELKCIHILSIIIVTMTFTSFMIYFMSLSYNEIVEIDTINHSIYDNTFKCKSIGSISSDQYDFILHQDNKQINNTSKYEFIQYNAIKNYTYTRIPRLNISNWPYEKPLSISEVGGTMNYTVDKGNGENLETCNSKLFQQLCNVTNIENSHYKDINIYNTNNAIKVYFWYDIITVINMSKYENKLKWYYNNIPDIDGLLTQFHMIYYDHVSDSTHYSMEFNQAQIPNIPKIYTHDNCTFSIPNDNLSPWYYALANAGSLSSVWDLCNARFVDIGNYSVYIGGHSTRLPNETMFKIDPKDGMVECWYNDRQHGLIKTDYHDSYGQNNIIPTPSNDTGIMLIINGDLFEFSDVLTTISSNNDISYIRLYDDNIITTDDALQIWQNNICKSLIGGYCNWVDVPPYFCKKAVQKTLIEALCLSLSPTTTTYSILLISILLIMKCKSYISKSVTYPDDSGNGDYIDLMEQSHGSKETESNNVAIQ